MISGTSPGTYRHSISILNSFRDPEGITEKEVKDDVRTAKERLMKLLDSCQITLSLIDTLNIIQIAGTKGKGSTSALTEALLRSLGYKTGLYTGPHMKHTTERWRINGQPISEESFQKYFSRFEEKFKKWSDDDPIKVRRYHKVCTALAFHIFLEEKVDVAIFEIHIGGEHCHSNIMQNSKVALITTLDYDHMNILGETLPEIAWHKAGIFKKKAHAVVTETTPDAWKVIEERGKEREVSSLSIAPPFAHYKWDKLVSHFGLSGDHHHYNISLALQGARAWLKAMDLEGNHFTPDWFPGQSFNIIAPFCTAIEQCKWMGRNEIIKQDNLTFYLDCAYTPKSIEACVVWFLQNSSPSTKKALVYNVLNRDPLPLWESLKTIPFDHVIFGSSLVDGHWNPNSDLGFRFVYPEKHKTICERNIGLWKDLTKTEITPFFFASTRASMEYLQSISSESSPIEVLVIGFSITGAFLTILEEKLPH